MNSGAPIPARSLLTLTAAVLLLHFWLLGSPARRIHMRETLRAAPFATRSIPLPPVATSAVAPQFPQPHVPDRIAVPVPATRGSVASPPVTKPTIARSAAPPAPATETIGSIARPAPPIAAPNSGAIATRFAIPASIRLEYAVTAQVKHERTQGISQLSWQHDGDIYEAQLEIRAPSLPARLQHSSGRITTEGLAPLRFSEKTRTEQATHFERDSQRLSFSNNRPAAALLAGAQDRVSVLLQLSAMLAGEPHKYPAGSSVMIQTATTSEAEPWTFTIQGEERLELPGGTLVALKLVRPPKRQFDQQVEVWLAPGLDYVPVRLRLTQPNGDWVDQQWSSTDRR